MSLISLQFQKQLGETQFDVDLDIPATGITAIFGRSGAGKTSLINVISGLIKPDSGLIKVNDRILFDDNHSIDVAVEKRNVGYVFQDARLFPHYSVKGNLTYGVKQADDAYFSKVVTLLSLTNMLDRYPADLSGGEKQRVAIGRALLSKPDILLMDEPLASLDLPRKREVMPFLEKLADEVKTPILYVTHSLNEILRLASHLVIVNDGKVEISGSIEEVWGSNSMRPWQSFSEQSSLFEATIAEHHRQYALTKVQLAENVFLWVQGIDGKLGSSIRLQVRANDVSIALDKPERTSIRNILKARVSLIESKNIANDKQSVGVQLDLGTNRQLWATITPWALDELDLNIGMDVYVQIKGVSVTQRDIAFTHE